jgi:structural maintenance of chromosomes protein 5
MPSGPIPQRRRRTDEDVDAFDDISVDGEGSVSSSNGRKRARVSQASDDDDRTRDGSDNEDGSPVLPDNFRRSPKGKGRATERRTHQPGSIVRVKLTDFVTYSSAEFNLGPNLNMIIGPNGTGKSTLVCAICLGLGFKPENLGRAKNIAEFVKNGTKRAEIEIELAADPERHDRNPVITTRINRTDKNPTFMLNGRQTTKKELDRLMRSFSIQIDNLCQFLPQDRVVEFAALSPVNLLAETQRAAAPQQVVEWHEELKEMAKTLKTRQAEQQTTLEQLKSLEKRQASQENDVRRLRERAEAQVRLQTLEKLKPLPEYMVAQREHKEAKRRMKTAARDLRMLEAQAAPNLAAEQEKTEYLKKVKEAVASKERLLDRFEKHAEDLKKLHADKQAELDEIAASLDGESKRVKDSKTAIPELLRRIRAAENTIANPPAEADFAAMNEEAREKTTQSRDLRERLQRLEDDIGGLKQQIVHQKNIIAQAENDRAESQTQAGQQANKLKNASPSAARAWHWIQQNRAQFEGAVYGPPIVECSVKNTRHAAAVESIIQQGELMAFTVTSQRDFNMLSDRLYHQMKLSGINIRSINQRLDYFRPPCSAEQLRSFGLEAWVLDLIDGPDEVLAMLCDNRNIHATGFTSGELSIQKIDALKAEVSPITSWVTATDTWQVTRRREYNASSTRSNALRPARYWTDAPASHYEDAELAQRMEDAKRTIADLEANFNESKEEYNRLANQREQVEKEIKRIKTEKTRIQKEKSDFQGLAEKLRGMKEKVNDARAIIRESNERKRELVARGDDITLEKGQKALDYANALRDLHKEYLEAKIVSVEAQSDLDQLKARTEDERRMLEERKQEVEELERVRVQCHVKATDLATVLERLRGEMGEDEYLHNAAVEIKGWEPAQLQTEIESVQARLEMNGGGDVRIIREFEKRAQDIESCRNKLADVEAGLRELEERITEVRGQWEPELDGLVSRISDAFADNFSKIQCAGEVALHKDEDFEQWAIQIRVKFRCVYPPLTTKGTLPLTFVTGRMRP